MKETSRTNMLFLNETKLLTDVSEFVFEQENFPLLVRIKHFSDQQDSGKGRCSETRCSENQSSENLSFFERYWIKLNCRRKKMFLPPKNGWQTLSQISLCHNYLWVDSKKIAFKSSTKYHSFEWTLFEWLHLHNNKSYFSLNFRISITWKNNWWISK